jgi:hypothetical protein
VPPRRRRGKRPIRTPTSAPGSRRMGSHWRADGAEKTRFRSADDANRAAFAYRLEHGVDLAVYSCEVCGGWHMGRTPDY